MRKILLVAATRPNFIKIAPLYLCLKDQDWCDVKLVYLAQHPPGPMTTEIAASLGIASFDKEILVEDTRSPMHRLGVLAETFAEYLSEEKPDIVVVPGDVDASLAATIATKRAGIAVAHLEAGLRSFDASMPEELNRVLIDSIADLHLTPSKAAWDNLVYGEGRSIETVHFVGNIMIDTLRSIHDPSYHPQVLAESGLERFILCTFHRPANVDAPDALDRLAAMLGQLTSHHPVLFPMHPRTRQSIETHGRGAAFFDRPDLHICDPIAYIDFIHLIGLSQCVVTDSGGVQEEAAFLKRHCFTFRNNTERPQTVECGSNHLISDADYAPIIAKVTGRPHTIIRDIPLWDGLTSERVASALRLHPLS
ncbi:non-hydrolyzing UDP-N-acetylglucosamine 2-epimerase [Sulfitobacter sabulilitoris]|uniref:UDP-N-acetylglucosamine 2-epimerase (Non-hydrolyzing) n=1 Tax=Sulfitobacter sabulilitoris TaxID=2562655 RepID=A0A5S3PF64_9RHOB|nr:UDP-N-acetylglucosamine 2-epimerase (non-hydrolyzing) [Sulfitobacter sabulilitoris]TMM52677.1 UDP-N-acetylglucosamine 2-epimerase (non-hydrolyzing) [Sulfitobacter sabulilitoris]